MKITRVLTEEDINLTISLLSHDCLSFTERAIIKEFLNKCTKYKAILLDDYKAFIEKEINIATGEE